MMSTPRTNSHHLLDLPFIQFSKTIASSHQIVPAPTINVQVTTRNGQANIDILLDSGADISAAGQDFVHTLGEHIVWTIWPSLTSLQKRLMAHFCTQQENSQRSTLMSMAETQEDVHIYPLVSGAVISWLAAKHFGILQENYLQPTPVLHKLEATVTAEQLMNEFPTI